MNLLQIYIHKVSFEVIFSLIVEHNKVPRRILGFIRDQNAKWRKLQDEETDSLYILNVVKAIKYR